MTREQEVEFNKLWDPLMEGWLTKEKGRVLFDLVIAHKPELCVEVGTFGGMSEIAIAMALRANGKGIIFGIDPWRIEPCLEGNNLEANNDWWKQVPWGRIITEYYQRLQAFDLFEWRAHFRKHDADCLKFFNGETVNLIHFDSNHSEEVSCATVVRWWPKLASGCVIIMDDIDWEGQSKAVGQLLSLGATAKDDYKTYATFVK